MLFTEDASFYAEGIKQGDYTVRELVDAALENIATYNASLNAVTHTQTEEAQMLADDYDKQLAELSLTERQQLPAFFGVPILLKDAGHNEARQPATSGSQLLKDQKATETTNFVKSILDVGFVVVGRTNTPEFALKGISDSLFHGSVNLPQDLTRNAGGSSGGAATAVKAGLVPIATASDGGGSIRIPASFNGLLGLKVSNGRTAHGPFPYRNWQGAAVDFAMTRSVRDTWRLLKALQVEQYDAPFTLPLIEEKVLEPLDRPLKIAYLKNWWTSEEPDPAAEEMMKKAYNILEELDHELVEAFPDYDIEKAAMTYFNVYAVETTKQLKNIVAERGREIEKEEVEPITWALYQIGQEVKAVNYSETIDFWDQLGRTMEAFFEDYDLILVPTATGPAPIHGTNADQQEKHKKMLANVDEIPFEEQLQAIMKTFEPGSDLNPYTSIVNISGTTAISLPMYETPDNLPIGTMLWGGKGQEYLLLQVAKQLEAQGQLKTDVYKGTEV